MSFATAYGVKKRMGKGAKCAEGGEIEDESAVGNVMGQMQMAEGGELDDADMIARIVHKYKSYSQGGMVANDVGVAAADELPAEYDDLVLRDDLEDTSGPGNEIGDPKQTQRDDDVVGKILASRKKKDRMPRPA